MERINVTVADTTLEKSRLGFRATWNRALRKKYL